MNSESEQYWHVRQLDQIEFLKILYPAVLSRIEFYYSMSFKTCLASLTNTALIVGWRFVSQNTPPDISTKIIVSILLLIVSTVFAIFLRSIFYWSSEYGKIQYSIEKLFKGYEQGTYLPTETLFPPTAKSYGVISYRGARWVEMIYFIVPFLLWLTGLFVLWTWNEIPVHNLTSGNSNQVIERQTDQPMGQNGIGEAIPTQPDTAKDNTERQSHNNHENSIMEVKETKDNAGQKDSAPAINTSPP